MESRLSVNLPLRIWGPREDAASILSTTLGIVTGQSVSQETPLDLSLECGCHYYLPHISDLAPRNVVCFHGEPFIVYSEEPA